MNTPYASASLYVGDLAPDVTEALLFDQFNPVGPVASIRVCRDSTTRRSLGYAYVNFHNVVDAERALDTMNYTNIKGRPCRIMWSHRDPSVRRSGVGNVFIKNLDKSINNQALYDTFSAFGNILSCKVMTDHEGNSLGYGFVHYETAEGAQQAIEKVNGMLLNDKIVYVGKFVPRNERDSSGPTKFTNIYIKNLPESFEDADLLKLFEEFGAVKSHVIMRDADGKSRKFGFVNFEEAESAAAAVEKLNESEVEGETLIVCRAQKKAEREAELRKRFDAMRQERMNKYQGVNLYVKNLDDTVTDEDLRNEFASFGTITSAKVMTDDKGVSKGFGFVCFSTPEEATKAVTEMNGRMLANKPIYVALAQRKEIRRAQLEAQHAQRANQMRMQGGAGGMGVYPGGAPVYYPPGGAMGPGRFVYPQGAMMRGRWPPNAAAAGGRGGYMGGYMMPVAGGAGGRGGMNNPNPNAQGGGRGGRGGRGGGGGGRGRGYKSAPPAGAPIAPGGELTPSALVDASPSQQKQIIGEQLYPKVAEHEPVRAGKITGMLLEMENSDLLDLLQSPDRLAEKVQEAVEVLKQHQAKQAATEAST